MTMKLAAYINRFTFGEVSPYLCGRSDLEKYGAACKTLVNFIPLLQGPVQRRGGTRFIAKAGNGVNPVALIDFAFSETTAYVLEFGNRYMRVFYQGAQVMSGSSPYQITTPWTQADLFQDSGICNLKWVQSGDVMFIVCPGQPPQKLSRYGHTNWQIAAMPGWSADKTRPNATAIALFRERLCLAADQTVYMSQSGAFANFEPGQRGMTEATLTMTKASGYWRFTANAAAGTVTATDTGTPAHYITYSFNSVDELNFNIINASSKVTVTPKKADGRISRIGVTPSKTDAKVTPSSVAGTITSDWGDNIIVLSFDPLKGSISSDASHENGYIVSSADIPVAADDPLEISVYSEQMDKIEWLSPSESLLVGTSGGEFTVGKATSVDPLGPENIEVIPQTSFGSSPIQALRVGAVLLFVQRAGRRVREFAYDYAGDNYLAMDVTVAAEHVTRGGLTCLVWQSEPIETLWAARSDGQLIGFTYSKDQDMTAWHRHELGGGGKVKSLAVVPAAHGGRDELWLSVQRTVGGQVINTVERMEPGHEYGADVKEAFFVDSGLTVRGSGLTAITGLGHLEGLEVDVLGDGAPQHRQVVSGGQISLTFPVNVVQVGLPFESRLVTVNMEIQMKDGTAQARAKRINKVFLRLLEAGGGAAGPDPAHLEQLEFRRGSDSMDTAVSLFSGDREINWPGGWEKDGSLTVVQNYPLPFTLAAMVAMVNIDGLS